MKINLYDGSTNLIPVTILDIYNGEEALTSDIITKLTTIARKGFEIFWSDDSCKHWIMDFKIDGVWFCCTRISTDLKTFEFAIG